jgi:hypothetical protein
MKRAEILFLPRFLSPKGSAAPIGTILHPRRLPKDCSVRLKVRTGHDSFTPDYSYNGDHKLLRTLKGL